MPVTKLSPIPLKPTGTGRQYFLYRKVTFPRLMRVPCLARRSFSVGVAFSCFSSPLVAFSSLLIRFEFLFLFFREFWWPDYGAQ